jgi:hypothetical protein
VQGAMRARGVTAISPFGLCRPASVIAAPGERAHRSVRRSGLASKRAAQPIGIEASRVPDWVANASRRSASARVVQGQAIGRHSG